MSSLNLTFNSIANANILVGDASVVGDWNTFFDLPTYGTPFSAVTISGNTVQLFGGSNIVLNYNNYVGGLFNSVTSLLSIYDYAGSITELIDQIFVGSGLLECYFNSVTNIEGPNDGGVFSSVTTKIHAPNCSNIGWGAFQYCSELFDLDLDFSNITSLTENYIFYECLLLPDSVVNQFTSLTSITGQYCFQYCESLTNLNLPSVTNLGRYTFSYCTGLTTCDLSSVLTLNNFCFYLCTSLTSITLPNLKSAGVSCFSTCTSLTSISFLSLTGLSQSCFAVCNSLTTIDLPLCTNLGGTVANNNVFLGITGNTINLTIPTSLMTCNAGNPDGDIQYLQTANTVTIIEPTPIPSPTQTPTPTLTPSSTTSIVTTPTPTPTKTSSPTPSVTPTNTPSPTFIPYTGVPVNNFYAYTIEILGDFSGGTAPANAIAPHPIMIGNDGIPYAQMNAIQIGGFGGLNN
jgi:hypothetical protein